MTDNKMWRRRAARLAFRVMLSGIFLIAGSNHLFRTGAITGRLEQAPYGDLVTMLAPPEFLVLAAGVALLIGGLALLTGFATRWAAAGLIGIVIPITLVVQTAGLSTLGPLFKNVGLIGGLI
ncbi:MAG: DoxX family membrane protein, partial [Bradymonadaceae bacterium]